MARLSLVFALSLIVVGSVLGGLALSGYYQPQAMQARPVMKAEIEAGPGSYLLRVQPRRQFLAVESKSDTLAKTAPKAAPKPKVVAAAKAPPTETKPKAKEKRPQQTALQWPWNMFGN